MRAVFPSGQQQNFLEEVQRLTGQKAEALASRIGVCARTFRDWRREKWQVDDVSLDRLCRLTNLPRPRGVTILPEHWSVPKAARLGGLRHSELYGSPGTPEGRSRGGKAAQRRFKDNPEHFRALGVTVRKKIQTPTLSADLAEFIGIVLGDGGITDYQVKVSFDKVLDADYADYVSHLIKRLFGLTTGRSIDPHDHALDIVCSSVQLVELLESFGLKRGNKIRQQVDLPHWIWRKDAYRVACLRGLMDTDGSVYRHRYAVNGKMYSYVKLCFASRSQPLLSSAKRLFELLQLFPTIHYTGDRLYLHNTAAVRRYFSIVGTHHPRYLRRFKEYTGEVPKWSHGSGLLNRRTGVTRYRGFESLPLRQFLK